MTRVRVRRGVVHRVGPVGERAGRVGRTVGVVRPVAVRDRHALAVAVQAGERGQQVVRGVRDQWRVVVGQKRAVTGEEVQQVRHHLQVGRDVGVVPEEVHIVERQLDHVLDAVPELAAGHGRRRGVRFRSGVRGGGGSGAGDRGGTAQQRRNAGQGGDAAAPADGCASTDSLPEQRLTHSFSSFPGRRRPDHPQADAADVTAGAVTRGHEKKTSSQIMGALSHTGKGGTVDCRSAQDPERAQAA